MAELAQFDGSRHRRFEGRGPSRCLITMTDDATNTRLPRFCEEETIAGTMGVFSCRVRAYGIPEALYRDRKNAFVLTREPADAELLAGIAGPKNRALR